MKKWKPNCCIVANAVILLVIHPECYFISVYPCREHTGSEKKPCAA